jgi:hypothetical protein
MKKSRIAKLALMGASITALAATLTTSTYAWYVSNKTATVGTATGATAAGTADGSILLSWDGEEDTYFRTLEWTDDNAPEIQTSGVFNVQLNPVLYVPASSTFKDRESYKKTEDTAIDGSKTYYTEASGVFTAVASPNVENIGTYYEQKYAGAATTAGYVQFDMYIKADATTNVTITPTMANTTDSNAVNGLKQIAHVATGGVEARQPFIVNSFNAMYYSLNVDDAATATAVVAAPASTAIAGAVAPGDAHNYYEEVTGEVLTAASKAAVQTQALTTLSVGTTAKKLTWTIWLAGNDADCYNSCAGQSFSFALTYKAA